MRLRLCGAAIAIAIVVVLVLGGCGSDSGSSTSGDSGSTATTAARTTPAQTVVHYINRDAKPPNPGPHPNASVDQLVIRDIRKGTGPEIHAGDSGIFEFIASNWETGAPLESTWHKKRPFETQIEKNVVIEGWWQGIPGMRVGGRRTLLIPASLGFTTNPELIGRPVYFDVVLVELRPQAPAALGGRGTATEPPAPQVVQ